MSLRHKYGTGTTPTLPLTELHSAESKMRMNVEKSNENKKMSLIFVMACLIGITSGFLIGYMTGIIGGVIFGTGYGNQFFSKVYNNAFEHYGMVICFVPAALYIFGSIGITIRKHDISRLDMRRHMILSGALVSIGSVVTALTTSEYVYILGPNLFALGFGIMYQGAQIYMSEMGFAHRSYLPALNIAFKMMIAIGIFVANLLNWGTNSIKGGWGWKVSIGMTAVPDTPMSMIKLGKFDDAKQLLQRLHGTSDSVYILFKDLLAANEASKSAKGCEMQILSQAQNRPYHALAIAFPFFQQLTGMNVIVTYAPYLFQVIGFQTRVNVAATLTSIILVSLGCRRFFLIAGGVQLFVGQIMLGIVIWIKLGSMLGPSDVYDYLIIATTCFCVSGFAWSCGPLGWIFLSSDDMLLLYPLEVRSCGQNLASRVHWNFSGFITFVFPFVVCRFQFYVLYLFAFFAMIMTILAYYFMPDTNQILVEEDVSKVWKQHWYWRRYFVDLNYDPMV
ncbi:hypothetical protein MKX03_023664 [Papaver bracteatum]|nr:hypothetical protein MKX03_023664 [Papaver bracteatum]